MIKILYFVYGLLKALETKSVIKEEVGVRCPTGLKRGKKKGRKCLEYLGECLWVGGANKLG